MAKAKQIKFTTPVGELCGFVALEVPSTKFDPAGVYSTKIKFDNPKDIEFMQSRIDKCMAMSMKQAGTQKAAKAPYIMENDELVVNLKVKAVITGRDGTTYDKAPKIYDSNNKPVAETLGMSSGTTARVVLGVYMWNVTSQGAGVTLQPQFVQVANLVKFTAEPADPFSGAIDGSFTANNDDVFGDDNDSFQEEEKVVVAPKEEVVSETSDDDFDF